MVPITYAESQKSGCYFENSGGPRRAAPDGKEYLRRAAWPGPIQKREDKQMNWQVWLKGLAAAVVGGAATGATHAVSTTGTVNQGTAITAAAGALVTVLAYLMKSPLGGQVPPLTGVLTPPPATPPAQ